MVIKKICVVCGREFPCNNKPLRRRVSTSYRPCNSVTCSPKCSRKNMYNSIRHRSKKK